uniref:Ubiquitin-conjugating enzyme E2Q-like protein 1 n=1 Tax=Eptatretus burgeri TaxID=7764 RepID=A0A8C4Q5W6_EPTBU
MATLLRKFGLITRLQQAPESGSPKGSRKALRAGGSNASSSGSSNNNNTINGGGSSSSNNHGGAAGGRGAHNEADVRNNVTSDGKQQQKQQQKHSGHVRARRLMKELQDLRRTSERFLSVELVEDNLFEWNVRLFQIDRESPLWQDMRDSGHDSILLNLTFPENFPFSPPFMRVLSPRIDNGFVLDGGAICMELLTPRGWSSAYTVEAVVRQFAASVVKGQGRISRKKKAFTRKEAEATFRSLVKTHEKYGWVTPPTSDG